MPVPTFKSSREEIQVSTVTVVFSIGLMSQ
jgi:hypothetical protein